MRKVTIGNMLEMLVLADMYKAPDLREATKYAFRFISRNAWTHLPQEPDSRQLEGAAEEEAVEGEVEGVRPPGFRDPWGGDQEGGI